MILTLPAWADLASAVIPSRSLASTAAPWSRSARASRSQPRRAAVKSCAVA